MSITHDVYRILTKSLGPQNWWPADSPFEVLVGAVLVQNTAWRNVERAIDNLKNAGVLSPQNLAALSLEELSELIRPAGYFRLKARRLTALVQYVVERFDGSMEAMRNVDAGTLRVELLGIYGVEPETADSILLYALDKPVMVVDAYTKRIWTRHGWIDPDADYYQLQEHIASDLPAETPLLNEFHAQLVNVGHHWCKTTPCCEECPLQELLPESGVLGP